ncbi:MAG TPA: acyl carrier protein [Dongiaceae bacterium]|nr:acyl carrier protein [Dongiaceae bacterium]
MEISQADIVREIATLLKPFRKDATPISGETDISRDLNLDSLSVMDFIMELEEKFDVSIPLNLVPEIQTVADLAATIHRIKGSA